MNKLGQRWVVMIGIMVIAVGCATNRNATGVARTWIEAFFSSQGTVLANHTCRASHAIVSEASLTYQLISGLGGFLQGMTLGSEVVDSSIKVDFSQVQFRIVEQSSSRAVVETSGVMVVSVGGIFQEQDAEYSFNLVKEDGNWKVCEPLDAVNRILYGY